MLFEELLLKSLKNRDLELMRGAIHEHGVEANTLHTKMCENGPSLYDPAKRLYMQSLRQTGSGSVNADDKYQCFWTQFGFGGSDLPFSNNKVLFIYNSHF